MRAGAGWQAHLGEPKRWEARRRRFSPPSRAHLAIIRRVGDAAASSLTCGTHCSSVRSSPSWRPATLHGARHSPCSVAGLQLGLERTDERCVPQHVSDANREETSDLCHLPPDLTKMKSEPVSVAVHGPGRLCSWRLGTPDQLHRCSPLARQRLADIPPTWASRPPSAQGQPTSLAQ